MFIKQRVIVDTTSRPYMFTRWSLDVEALKQFALKVALVLFIIAMVAATIFVATFSASAESVQEPVVTPGVVEEPFITAHCYSEFKIVFEDLNGNTLAYVDYASAEQVAELQKLSRVQFDDTINIFRVCKSNVDHYELYLAGEKCFMHSENAVIPSIYNDPIDLIEEREMLLASSEEVQYLYNELNRIFNVPSVL